MSSHLLNKLLTGDRIALSRAITLVESRLMEHQAEANALLDQCMQLDRSPAMRVAVSGAPGVGKSTSIEALGREIITAGKRLAVLAVDPSSVVSGGSVLGDKTRMQYLSTHPAAFVRPSPSGSTSGGVADRTREAVLLCEAAGFDVIIVETVGVGQSEIQVRQMVDILLLLIAPGGGDEVQGIKRGILELADVVMINKCDGDLTKAATETRTHYTHALRLLRGADDMPDVMMASALTGSGIPEAWQTLVARFMEMENSDTLRTLRNRQDRAWFDERSAGMLLRRMQVHPAIAAQISTCQKRIAAQEMSVRSALATLESVLENILQDKMP